MRLLILGASGGIGRWLTRLAAERGHDVHAVVRARSAFEPPGDVTTIRGDVLDPVFLDEMVAGSEAVISSLGIRRAGKSPSAPLLSPPDLTEKVTRQLVPAMQRHGVNRVVAVSAGGVGDSFERLSWPVKKVITAGSIAVAYRDLAAMESILHASGLDWLAVRPVTLVDGAPAGGAKPVERYGMFSRVRRADVAEWILSQVESATDLGNRTILLGS